jgi:hypothetical protein
MLLPALLQLPGGVRSHLAPAAHPRQQLQLHYVHGRQHLRRLLVASQRQQLDSLLLSHGRLAGRLAALCCHPLGPQTVHRHMQPLLSQQQELPSILQLHAARLQSRLGCLALPPLHLLAQQAVRQQAAHQLLAQQSLIRLCLAVVAGQPQVLLLALLQLLLLVVLLAMLQVVWQLHLQVLPTLLLLLLLLPVAGDLRLPQRL